MLEILSLAGGALSPASAAERLRVADLGLMRRLIDSAQAAIKPAAAFRAGYVDQKRAEGVVVDGVAFTSRVLRRNLDTVGRVFPFVLTLGREMDGRIDASGDMLEKYLLEEIANLALREARGRFEAHLRSAFALEKISCMAPGSLEDWPIEQQRPLFGLLPGVEAALGVRLTESFLMLPRKSISGIYFPSEATFFSCQLCPRERCDGRKARYDEQKAREYGVLK
ncbi:MAG: hypothetical protein MUD16_09290 [Desulfobacterales bacterium]|jgi:hypothetical protein|nr:hypothetical protein [Desulfobacterales bacterium]